MDVRERDELNELSEMIAWKARVKLEDLKHRVDDLWNEIEIIETAWGTWDVDTLSRRLFIPADIAKRFRDLLEKDGS